MHHGGNDIAQNTVHRCTIFSAKDSFMMPALKHTYHVQKIRVISFFNRANPFHRVCPFHFYGICKTFSLDSGC